MRLIFLLPLCLALVSSGALAASAAEQQKLRQSAEVATLVAHENYAALEQLAEQDAASRARFADGLWRLSLLYADFSDALAKRLHDKAGWERATARLVALTKKNPQAWLLVDEAYTSRAWSVRGTGFSSEVKSDAWPEFRRNLTLAREVLDRHKQELAGNPAWYSHRLTLATELDEGAEASNALFNEAVARHPAYHAIYFTKLRDASPIWHGDEEQMLDLLDHVAHLGPITAKEGLYARLVWIADDSGFALTHSPRINAEALHDSVIALAEAYPDQWNVQKMFFMACERSDKPLAQRMLAKIAVPALPTLWKDNLPLFQTCKDWSEGRLSTFVIRDHEGDRVEEFLIK